LKQALLGKTAAIVSEAWKNIAEDNMRLQTCRMRIMKKYEILERGFRDKYSHYLPNS
jgi:hypothetical protein